MGGFQINRMLRLEALDHPLAGFSAGRHSHHVRISVWSMDVEKHLWPHRRWRRDGRL
ncbi:hypothetical protein CUJ84_Chr000917 [Rhizobium leguminosarum]|uniref:Uncharacterized protein n=1 Tax=Rhizobium leguminosarum TaxID=384 RepID=A0A2K9YZD3_RHILE|nr:hypothetical protein CUJ84_Chr000917 [Rhizobium leguminosarum]